MAEREQCEAQQRSCSRLWAADIKRLEERFMFVDKAIGIQNTELMRRLQEANNIKHEFATKVSDLKLKVATLEANSSLWLKIIGFGLAGLQIIIGIILRFLK